MPNRQNQAGKPSQVIVGIKLAGAIALAVISIMLIVNAF